MVMEEEIRKICKFKDGFTNAIACLIVADMFMGNTITKIKQQGYETRSDTYNK